MLQIPALCSTSLPDVYYRNEGGIFLFVDFTFSSLFLKNYSTVILLQSVDCFYEPQMLYELLFLEQY